MMDIYCSLHRIAVFVLAIPREYLYMYTVYTYYAIENIHNFVLSEESVYTFVFHCIILHS